MKSITLEDAIRDYLADCEQKHLAKSTIRRYRITLAQFSKQLIAAEPWIELQFVPVEAWQQYVMDGEAQLANKSFNAKRSHLSAFLRWAYERGYLDPAEGHLRYVPQLAPT